MACIRGLAGLAVLAFPVAMALMSGCGGGVSNPAEPDFYISHVQDPSAIWYRSAPSVPAPLTIAALPPGSSVNQVVALSFTGTSDWLYALTSSNLIVLDKVGASFQTLATVPVGTGAFACDIDANADFAYVSNNGSNSVTVVDLNAYQAAATIALPAGSQPRGVVLTPDGKKLYVAAAGTNRVSVIDTIARAVTGSITVGNQPNRLAVAPSGHEVYVSNSGSGTVSVIDVLTDTVSATITGLPNTLAVAVSGSGVSLLAGQAAAPSGPGSISSYATSTLTPTTSANSTPGNAFFLTAIYNSSSSKYSYLAASENANKVTEYLGNFTSLTDLKVGVAPTSVTVVRAINRTPSIPTQPQCKLTVTTVGNGTVTVNPASTGGSYPCGTTVTLTAVPGTGQAFFGWSVDLTGAANPASLTLNANKNVTATFGTAYEIDPYGCPVTITSTAAPVSTSPLSYPANTPITINSTLPAVEVLFKGGGAWTTYTSFPVTFTLSGPVSIWVPCVIPKTSACVAPPAGMAGWWGFEPTGAGTSAGSITDLSGNGNNGALTGGVTQAGGKVQSFLASGSAYLQVPSSNSLNFGTGAFSGDLWVRWSDPSVNTVDNFLLDKFTGANRGFQLALTRSVESPGIAKLMLRIYAAVTAEWDTIPPAVPSDGLWHLVAFSYDPSKLLDNRAAFYVDGVLVPSQPFNTANTAGASQTIALNVSSSAPLTVGRDPVLPQSFAFTGGIDEVELFNRVITAADLQPLMAADSLGKCEPSQSVSITVNTSPAGLAASVNGIGGTAPVSQGVASGVATPVSVTTPQVVNGSGYTFSNWTGAVANPASASTTVTATANTTVTANFALSCYLLTFNVSPPASGSVTPSPALGGLAGLPANCYAPGTVVTLAATGANGNVLQSWTGAPGTNATTSVTVNAPTTVTANFGAPVNVTLTVATNPTSLQGRIGTSAAYAAAPISQQVPANQTQTISVTDPQFVTAAGTGYRFTGWSTGGSTATTTVQPSTNFTATANFSVACYALTVVVAPAGSGTVAASPASGGLAGLPTNCYAPGTTVTLTATGTAAQDYIFGSWSGAGTGFTIRTVVMNGPSAVTANFTLYPAPNLNFGGANWGYASGSTYQMVGNVGNNGADYNNIKINQVVWTAAAGTGAITDTTALPITIGNLAGGTGALSSSLTLNATMPTTVTQFKVCVSGTAVSPLSGNTVAWTDNQNCSHAFPRN